MFADASSVMATAGWALVHTHAYPQRAILPRKRKALRHLLGEPSGGRSVMPLPEGRRRVGTKDHASGANPNLIAIMEIGGVRDETLTLDNDPIRGLEIFDDEGGSASQDTRVVATDMRLGQTEKLCGWRPSTASSGSVTCVPQWNPSSMSRRAIVSTPGLSRRRDHPVHLFSYRQRM